MTTPTTSQALEQFTLFPNLPVEIRLKIWNLAVSEDRVVEVFLRDCPQDFGYFTDTTTPVTFSVCKESLEETMAQYELLVVSTHTEAEKRPFQFYINYTRDSFHIEYYHFQRTIRHEDDSIAEWLRHFYRELFINQAKRLKIQQVDLQIDWDTTGEVKYVISKMPNLRRITLTAGGYDCCDGILGKTGLRCHCHKKLLGYRSPSGLMSCNQLRKSVFGKDIDDQHLLDRERLFNDYLTRFRNEIEKYVTRNKAKGEYEGRENWDDVEIEVAYNIRESFVEEEQGAYCKLCQEV